MSHNIFSKLFFDLWLSYIYFFQTEENPEKETSISIEVIEELNNSWLRHTLYQAEGTFFFQGDAKRGTEEDEPSAGETKSMVRDFSVWYF